jgi:hypothetical protein
MHSNTESFGRIGLLNSALLWPCSCTIRDHSIGTSSDQLNDELSRGILMYEPAITPSVRAKAAEPSRTLAESPLGASQLSPPEINSAVLMHKQRYHGQQRGPTSGIHNRFAKQLIQPWLRTPEGLDTNDELQQLDINTSIPTTSIPASQRHQYQHPNDINTSIPTTVTMPVSGAVTQYDEAEDKPPNPINAKVPQHFREIIQPR